MMRSFTALAFLLVTTVAFGQSRTELLQYGDAAFQNEHYASAVHFYLSILNRAVDKEKNVTYPYDVKTYIKPEKKKKSDSKASFTEGESNTDEKEKKGESDPGYQYVVHRVAESYRLNHDYELAEEWYAKSIENGSNQYPIQRYWYAVCLMKNNQYDKAAGELEIFLKEFPDNASFFHNRARQQLFNCSFAQDPSSTRQDITIQELDSVVNSGTSNFAASYYGGYDMIVFSSGRENNIITDEKRQDPNYLCDLYTSTKFDDGWGEPKNMGRAINTEQHEGTGILSTDRTTFYFTRWSPTNPNECSIYVTKFFNNLWMQPMKLDQSVNLEGFKSMHPALSEDESILFYTSNRPGGYGGMDIWFCTIDDYGSLSLPHNLGSVINTASDEVSPFHHYYTRTLYFSSEGHTGLGGFDIFKSTFSDLTEFGFDDSIWSTPVNIGRPVNSSRDDKFFVLSDKQLSGFFSSDRKKCTDCTDQSGYCYRIYSLEKPKNVFTLKGTVYNAETEEVIANSLVTFKDIRGHFEPFFLMTDENGSYFKDLKEGWDLFLKAQKVKFFGDAAAISTVGLTETKHFIQDFFLTPIPLGEIEIPGIEYDYDKATLRPASKKILDDLVDFLELNDNIIVELRSHTDERGTEEYNMKLSEERAQSVVNYLIAHGIDRERLMPQGYGETQPLFPGTEDEEEHQRNRRTAFKTIAQDYKDLQ